MSREALFAAVKPFALGQRLTAAHIPLIDAVADAFGLPAAGSVTRDLTAQDYADAARLIGCSAAQVRAVFEVEAFGAGWFTDVRADILARDGPGGFLDGPDLPKILFEAHWFDRLTQGRFRTSHPNLSSRRWNRALYVGGQAEYIRLHQAMALDLEAALKSASWGAAQIMGFNHRLAGFETVEAFVAAMKSGARAHLMAFVAFVKSSDLVQALKGIGADPNTARAFAEGYNGAGYAAHDYHGKIARAFVRWSR